MKGRKKRNKGKVRPARPSFTEFAREVLNGQFNALRRLESEVRADATAASVHDLRVIMRRMRAALRLFEPLLSEEWPGIRGELAWMADELGRVRDLDVLIGNVQRWLPELKGAAKPTQNLLEQMRKERESRRVELQASLDSDRFFALIDSIRVLLDLNEGEWPSRPVLKALPSLIEPKAKTFLRRVKGLKPTTPPNERHRIRILAKRLRYAVELSEPLYGKRAQNLGRELAAFQDLLGARQDAFVAREHLVRLVADRESLLPGLEAILARYDASLEDAFAKEARLGRKALPRAWKRYQARMRKLSISEVRNIV